jgi:hypothetical protein
MMGMKPETIISHLRAESELGTSIIININYIQLLAGISKPIFESKTDISYVPMNWLLHIRAFLTEINTTLEIQDLWLPKKQRQHDQFIMEAFITSKATKAELTILNNWRLYYQVQLYSELCFASGNGIQPLYLEYNHNLTTRQTTSNLNWTVQGKPDEKSFKIWRRYVKRCFKKSETNQITSLGTWNLSEVMRISPRKGYFDTSDDTIYITASTGAFYSYKTFEKSRTRGRFHNYDPIELTKVPKEAIPVDIFNQPESSMFHYCTMELQQIYQRLDDCNKWRQEILKNLIIEDEHELKTSLSDPVSTVNIVSDGGVHNYQSNYGVVIAIKSYSLATNMGKIYSVTFHESSYRAELYGMLAAVTPLRYIVEAYSIQITERKKL